MGNTLGAIVPDLYRFHCRNRLYRAIQPWLTEIATQFASSD